MKSLRRFGWIFIAAVLGLAWTSAARSQELRRPDAGRTIKVVILAGQSNMEGRADGRRLSNEDRARLERVKDRVQLAFNGEPVCPLGTVTPSDEIREIYQCDTIFGPELFFGIALAEAWPGERFLLIKRTAGATSLHGAWNPEWSPEKAAAVNEADGPRRYGELVDYVRSVLAGYNPGDYELRGMLWVQGESDASFPEAAKAYGSNLRALIQRVRTDTGREDLPFILFEVGNTEIVEQMNQTAETVPNVSLIRQRPEADSPDFYARLENGHYNHEGMKKLGLRFAEVFLKTYGQTRE